MENKIIISYTPECLEKISKALDTLCKEYNEELLNENPSVAKLAKMDEDFKSLEADYIDVKQRLVFMDAQLADRPMRAAILKHTFPIRKHKVSFEGEKDSKIKICKIEDVTRPIDLLAFDTYMKGTASANKDWPHMVTKLTMLLTADVAQRLGLDPKAVNDSFAMSDIARKIELGETPTSNTAMLKTVQSIVDAILYEENPETKKNVYRASSHDVAYLREIFSKKGKKELSVACAKPAFMRAIMADICHRIVADKVYIVEYKQKKPGDSAQSGEVETKTEATKKNGAKKKPAPKKNPDTTVDAKAEAAPATKGDTAAA